ncbi:MAG: 50S ribosomal protein L15 [Planctomycetota bacterium]
MILNDVHTGIQPRKNRKRIGRGIGSGHGKTAGRGHKGFFSRSGSSTRRGFQGGQMPLFRRVAKRGFSNNAFAPEIAVINVGTLSKEFPGNPQITPQMLVDKGLVPSRFDELKVLGDGDVTHPMTITAHRFSASAEAKVVAAGGAVFRIER